MLRKFFSDVRGNFAMLTAIAMVPILGGLALGIDYVEMSKQQKDMLNALDAAALAAARRMQDGGSDSEVTAHAQRVFAANIDSIDPANVTLTVDLPETAVGGTRVVVSGAFDYQGRFFSPFAKLRGDAANPFQISATSEVTVASRDIEVGLVLDVTGSMQGTRIADLRTAAAELVDIVVQDQQTPTYSKVALIPYSMGVNVGSFAQQVRGSINSGTKTSPGWQNYTFTNANGDQRTLAISNCVSERTGAQAYTDAAPDQATTKVGRNYASSNNPCLTNTIVPLSSDKAVLKSKISALQASGSTAGQIGLAWGWYMVSPKFAYLWPAASKPAAYGTENLDKVVVLMTDGEFNTAYYNGVIAKNSGSGSGSSSDHINWNATNGSSHSQALQLCTNMKKEGVIVYTVGLGLADLQEARDVISKCATSSAHVYLPNTGTELKDAFRAIAHSISKLRITS
jgi:Flp pilus assembly protein TadG